MRRLKKNLYLIYYSSCNLCFLIQWGVFELPEALPSHILSKLLYLSHGIYLSNHLSFPERLNCGTYCHPLLSLNPTIFYLLNLTSTTWSCLPFYLNFPSFYHFLLFRGFVLGPTAFPRYYVLKINLLYIFRLNILPKLQSFL